ncbi:hypothetical protein [Brevundimonas sp.]|jgi:hypothetical protein|uniref:hypothetical protein n=1 Tax=Brevundimonas sp. TaxID=1871086 RepID=UPI0037C0E1C0
MRLATRPQATLTLWDEITPRRRMVGVYAPDIHQAVEVTNSLRLPFPPAADIMHLARNHILTQEPFTGRLTHDRALVLSSIRAGRIYVSLDDIGVGRGFRFSALKADATVDAQMGDEVTAGPVRRFRVDAPEATRALEAVIRLIRNGQAVATSPPGASRLDYEDARPGVYRVEIVAPKRSLPQAKSDIVWIYSNPIYVRAPSD